MPSSEKEEDVDFKPTKTSSSDAPFGEEEEESARRIVKTEAATTSSSVSKSRGGSGSVKSRIDSISTEMESVRSRRSVASIRYVIFPDNLWIRRWDALMLFLVLAVALIIPYQVGVSAGVRILTNVPWMIINVLINLAFVVDTVLYFFRAYRDPVGRLVFDLRSIRRHYLRTYFFPNLLSVLPTTMVFYAFGTHALRDSDGFEDRWGGAEVLVTIKLFDLLKLIRFIRLGSIVSSSDLIRNIRERRKSYDLDIIKFSLLIVMVSHFFACTWAFVAFVEAKGLNFLNSPNWINNWYVNNYEEGSINPDGWLNDLDRYVLSLFWAIQTITSIGYGNVSPFTPAEWWVGCALQLLAGIMWAYVIGGLVGVVESMKGRSLVYRERIDQANDLIREFEDIDDGSNRGSFLEDEHGTTISLEKKVVGKRIRRYIWNQKNKSKSDTYASDLGAVFPVMETLSPELQLMSTLMVLKPFMDAVPYLSSKYLSNMEQAWVASECRFYEFSYGEVLRVAEHAAQEGRGIFIVKEGIALAKRSPDKPNKASFMLTRGKTFGEDAVLLEDDLVGSQGVINFLTYTKVVFLPRRAVTVALEKNRKAWKLCARWRYVKALILSGAAKKVV